MRTQPPRTGRTPAFSLAETIVAAALVSILAAAAINLASSAAYTRRLTADRARGVELARALMAEIDSQAYLDPSASIEAAYTLGPDAAETGTSDRSAFDDIDDYHNWNDTSPRAKDGSALSGFTGWARTVSVAWVDPSNLLATVVTERRAKRITVTVTHNGVTVSSLVTVRTYARDTAEAIPFGTGTVAASSITAP